MASEMNFAIRYLTEYTYDAEVVDNLNALRVKPRDNSRQRCDEFSVRLTRRAAADDLGGARRSRLPRGRRRVPAADRRPGR
jgi:hypothetical protein